MGGGGATPSPQHHTLGGRRQVTPPHAPPQSWPATSGVSSNQYSCLGGDSNPTPELAWCWHQQESSRNPPPSVGAERSFFSAPLLVSTVIRTLHRLLLALPRSLLGFHLRLI